MLGRIHLARQRLGPRRAGRRHPRAHRAIRWRRRWRRASTPPGSTARASPAAAARCSRPSPQRRSGGDGDRGPALADLVRARLAAGEPGEARRAVEAALAADPAKPARPLPPRRPRRGRGPRPPRPRRCYRALVAEAPALPEPHRALFRLLAGEGDIAAADAALEAGHRRGRRTNGELLFLRAGLRESRGRHRRGDRRLRDPLRPRRATARCVANNLASLLTARRHPIPRPSTRAYAIARRLRGSEVPEFQDTYGWILFLRGDAAAARGLSRQGGGGAARQRPGPVPPRRGRARPRQPRGGGGGLCRRPRRRRGRQPPAPGRDARARLAELAARPDPSDG